MCLGEVGRIVAVDVAAGTATVDVGERAITALLVALDDGGAALRPGAGVLVHLGLITEVLDEPTTVELINYRCNLRRAAGPEARPAAAPTLQPKPSEAPS